MNHRCFTVDVVDHVARITLARPDELNTMIPAFWRELPAIVNELSDAGDARAIVLSSSGKHFTAGMDLSVFGGDQLSGTGETGRVRANLRLNVGHLQDAFTALERARVPVIAAVQGGCIGGGVDMVCACDMRYATADAFFCIQEINIGMTADVGTLQRLPKLIPAGIAREYAYTGRRMSAARAYELGFVNGVYATHDEMIAGVMAVAAEIATRSPLAVWGSKEMITYARDHTVADGLNYIATWQTGMFQPADMTEAFLARAQKRDAVYDDLHAVRRGLE
ncbi:MAG: crotonase/enoyl-CoA hydratase family protein [Actinobacteria bacterium]|nr:MAG: crotonase/enoyl-CoA hydratase family protein [Actinomycetota bacterium]